MIAVKYWVVSGLIALVTLVGYKYNSMVSTIEQQELELHSKDVVIGIQAGNIEVMKEKFKDDIAREVFEATVEAKQKQVMEGLKYDDKNSTDINSTRIYL